MWKCDVKMIEIKVEIIFFKEKKNVFMPFQHTNRG